MSLLSVFGFSVDEIVEEKKTGRRARILKFGEKRHWRHREGRRVLVPSGEYEVVYQWIEPAEGRSRASTDQWCADGKKFLSRFQKAAPLG